MMYFKTSELFTKILIQLDGVQMYKLINFFITCLQNHYYQPMWTLVGAGAKTLEESRKPMSEVMPKKASWLKTSVVEFDPKYNTVYTSDGRRVKYDYLITALGLKVNFDKVSVFTSDLCTCVILGCWI